MSDQNESLAIALFSEIFMLDQLARHRLSRALPKGMELSHFSVLNHLARTQGDKTPAQLARTFHLTRGAMTNTLSKLEWAGHVHIRPDWEDARRKLVTLSPAGRAALNHAIAAIGPVIAELVSDVSSDKLRAALPILRELRAQFGAEQVTSDEA